MSNWDPAFVSKTFESAAIAARQYASNLRDLIRRYPQQESPYIRERHDEHLARQAVYDSFVSSIYLESREELIAEAKRRLVAESAYSATGAFSKECFETNWRSQMQALIAEYEKD